METQNRFIVTSFYKDNSTDCKTTENFSDRNQVFETLKERGNLISFTITPVELAQQAGQMPPSQSTVSKKYIIALSKPITKHEAQKMGAEGSVLCAKMDQYGYSLLINTRAGWMLAPKGTIVLDTKFNQIYPMPQQIQKLKAADSQH